MNELTQETILILAIVIPCVFAAICYALIRFLSGLAEKWKRKNDEREEVWRKHCFDAGDEVDNYRFVKKDEHFPPKIGTFTEGGIVRFCRNCGNRFSARKNWGMIMNAELEAKRSLPGVKPDHTCYDFSG